MTLANSGDFYLETAKEQILLIYKVYSVIGQNLFSLTVGMKLFFFKL